MTIKGEFVMNKADIYMKEAIEKILEEGYKDINPRPKYADGTPAHTLSINHVVRTYDLSKGEFPITSLRPIAWKSAIKEILWIYQDQSNDLNLLREKYNVNYWNEWESKDMPNSIGARYGEVVHRYDLMNKLLNELKNDPYGRRHIIDIYQYKELNETDGLYPCAFLTIWNVRNDSNGKEYLDMCLIQRSGDLLAASCSGVNEVQYSALLMMVARHCGYEAGVFSHLVCNEQIYSRHMEQAKEMLERYKLLQDKGCAYVPRMELDPNKNDFYEFTIDDFTLEHYEPIKPQIKFELGI